ncbi:kinase-like protein [Gigaspora margarita]|uniref:Kinase-like protein n=1 Tax=Gigaspora margarita TaxID=4874 RepID=A0A8H4A9K0_GIGMA|nr:kinase-like protein [Gigaspora margarita]
MQQECRRDLIKRILFEAQSSTIGNNLIESYKEEFRYIDENRLLTEKEKVHAKKIINFNKDVENLLFEKGLKYKHEGCGRFGFTTLFCEHCARDCLIDNFKNWTSGNPIVDRAIQNAQINCPIPRRVIEWIPYSDLNDIKFKTRGGFASIYTATWKKGIGMLMYEVVTGMPPFYDQRHENLAINILCGIRPTIPKGIPESYLQLMCNCWKSNPEDRPSILQIVEYFYGKIKETMKNSNDVLIAIQNPPFINDTCSITKSQLHEFKNFIRQMDIMQVYNTGQEIVPLIEFDNLSGDYDYYNNNNEIAKLSYKSLQDDLKLGIL